MLFATRHLPGYGLRSYTNRSIDVTENCLVPLRYNGGVPFLVTKLSLYYDR